jgi:RNA-directed DNA polymerase
LLIVLAILVTTKTKYWQKTITELETIAYKLILGAICDEKVIVHAFPKLGFGSSFPVNGGKKLVPPECRTISVYGQKRRAKNWLLYTILNALHPVSPSNYLSAGRGPDLLSDKIREQIEDGNNWVIVFDIKNFYSSVQGAEWLNENLKMPRKLVSEEIFTSTKTVLTMGYSPTGFPQDQFMKAARLGLAQGSATSLIVGRIVYEDILKTLFPCGRYFYYGDDGIIFATCKSAAVEIADALRGAFGSHPAGPFALKRLEVRHVQQGFDFVKYRYSLKLDGTIHITPALNSFKRYEHKVAEIFCKYEDPTERVEKIEQYTEHWLKAFPHWKANPISFEYLAMNTQAGIILGEDYQTALNSKISK